MNKYVIWSGRPPRALEVLLELVGRHDGNIVWIGKELADRNDAVISLCEYSELNMRRHVFAAKTIWGVTHQSRFSHTCVRAFCPFPDCPFWYEARGNCNGWVIHQIRAHTCQQFNYSQSPRTRRLGKHAYQAKMLAPLIISRIEQGLSITKGEIVAKLGEYLNTMPCDSFVHRVRLTALRQFLGKEVNYLNGMPQFIADLQEAGHRVKMQTKGKDDMINVAVAFERKRIEQSNKYRPPFLPAFQFNEDEVRSAL